MRARVPELFSTYGPGGVGGQHDPMTHFGEFSTVSRVLNGQ